MPTTERVVKSKSGVMIRPRLVLRETLSCSGRQLSPGRLSLQLSAVEVLISRTNSQKE
jgi:hypothetical protein